MTCIFNHMSRAIRFNIVSVESGSETAVSSFNPDSLRFEGRVPSKTWGSTEHEAEAAVIVGDTGLSGSIVLGK